MPRDRRMEENGIAKVLNGLQRLRKEEEEEN
jgi:hypothetical protein